MYYQKVRSEITISRDLFDALPLAEQHFYVPMEGDQPLPEGAGDNLDSSDNSDNSDDQDDQDDDSLLGDAVAVGLGAIAAGIEGADAGAASAPEFGGFGGGDGGGGGAGSDF